MARILIIGCGDIGGGLADNLARKGHDVTGLRRTKPATLSAVKFIQADVTSKEEMSALTLDFEQLVYILSPSGADLIDYKAVFKTGVNNVLNAMREQQLKIPTIFVSSSRVYGQYKGEWLNEKSTTEPKEEKGQTLLDAENKFLSFGKQATVVRFSGIYGRSKYFIEQLKKGAKIQKEPPYYTNRIHRDDCVAVLEFLLNKKINAEPLEKIYLASDCAPVSKWDVASYLASELKLKPCQSLMNVNKASQNKRLDSSLLRETGYEFKFKTYKDGYGETIGEQR